MARKIVCVLPYRQGGKESHCGIAWLAWNGQAVVASPTDCGYEVSLYDDSDDYAKDVNEAYWEPFASARYVLQAEARA